MNAADPDASDRTFYDDTDYADIDLQPADDVTVEARRAPRSTFAIRMDGRIIDALRELADQRGTRPTQLAREWIEERLEHERRPTPSGGGRAGPADPLLTSLDRVIALFASGVPPFRSDLVFRHGPVADLEIQAAFARMVADRLQDRASISVRPDVGIDLLVEGRNRRWAIEFTSAGVDLTPSFETLAGAAKHRAATAVLVSPGPSDERTRSLAEVWGVVVRRPDELDDLVGEMSMELAG